MPAPLCVRAWAAVLAAGTLSACADADPGSHLTSLVVTTPLAIVVAPLPNAYAGLSFQRSLQASGGQPPYRWTLASGALPGGLTLGSSGSFAGAPRATGIFTFGVKVTDGVGATADATFTLRTVTLVPLAIPATVLPAASLRAHYTYSFQASGGVPPFAWVKRSGSLPPGLTFSSAGVLSGIPTAAGTFAFSVEVQGSVGPNASRTVSLVVNGGPLNIVTRLVKAVRGVPSSETLIASGGTQPWTWSFPAAPPAWLALSSAGALGISATASGTFPINVRVRDAAGVTTTASVTIVVARRVAIVSAPPTDGTAFAPYSFAFVSNEGPAPYIYTRSSGALPPGLTLSAGGSLSGTPTTAGSFTFGVRVKAADGTTDTRTYTVSIASPPLIPFATLPSARPGLLYNVTLTAQRGRTPYTWTLVSGPPGLSVVTSTLGTRLAGTIVTAGQYPVVLRVTDASGALAERTFTLMVS